MTPPAPRVAAPARRWRNPEVDSASADEPSPVAPGDPIGEAMGEPIGAPIGDRPTGDPAGPIGDPAGPIGLGPSDEPIGLADDASPWRLSRMTPSIPRGRSNRCHCASVSLASLATVPTRCFRSFSSAVTNSASSPGCSAISRANNGSRLDILR